MASVSNDLINIPSLSEIPSGIASRLGFTVDLLSFARNTWGILAPEGSVAFTAFGALGASVMALSSSILTIKAIGKIWEAIQKEDYRTAGILTATSLPSMASYAAVSYGMLINKVATLAKASHIANIGGALLYKALPVMAAFNFISGTYANYTTNEFKKALDQNFESQPRTIDEQIVFAKSISKSSKATPDSPADKPAFLREIVKDYLKEKLIDERDDFLRKTSAECVEKVEAFLEKSTDSPEEYSEIVRLLNDSLSRTKAIQHILHSASSSAEFARQTSDDCLKYVEKNQGTCLETEESKIKFLQVVYEANYKTNLNSRFLQTVAVVGMIGSTALFVAPPAASPVFVAGSLVWMALDSSCLSKKIGDWFWENRKVYVLPQSLQDTSSKPEKSEQTFWLQTAAATALAPVLMPAAVLYYEGERVYRNLTDYLDAREISSQGYTLVAS